MPRDATLRKLADYFGITPAELSGRTRVSNSDTAQPDLLLKFNQLTPNGQKEVLAFIQFKLGQENK